MKSIIKKICCLALTFGYLNSVSVSAQPLATFEIGDATIDAYTTQVFNQSVFTRIDFDGEFSSPPNVFTMTPEFPGADDPCTIRIRNITTTGFDATCLEPLSSDRNSPDIPFEYIAIQNGGVTVPSNDGLSSTRFVSSCQFITAQQGRGINASFFDFNFNTTFNSPPALIAQVQSTINTVQGSATTPGGEPSFIDVSIENVTTTDADVAIELAETSTTNLPNGETICILAVERTVDNGAAVCDSLDFSSLGGPTTPVVFQALTSGAIIQGHDNMPCDSVSFASNCAFTSPPTLLAKQNTRNGPDGGFLRRCDTSTSAATFIYDEDQVGDNERSHTGSEAISILAFSQIFTTPVTLNSAKVSVFNRKASFKWETSAETFHLGFNLWGETSDGWVQLNRRLISSNGSDTDQTQFYSRSVRLTRQQASEISNFGISSVDSTGYEEFYGPFSEGQEYGEEANNEPVDWATTRNAFEQSMRERGFAKVNNRWRRVSSQAQAQLTKNELGVNRSMFDVEVQATGIHSIKGSDLIALNPSWKRQPLRRIALTLNGQPVPRHIISNNRRLDDDDQIIFNAQVPQGSDTPFLEHYTYRLSIDRSNAVDANTFDGRVAESDVELLATTALLEKTVTSRKLHSAGLTTGDPWYDARLLSVGNVAATEYSIDFDQPINVDQAGELDVLLFGSLDFPGEGDDHHVQVYVNDTQVSDLRFDGLIAQKLTLPLEPGLLKQTGNTVRVDVVGDTGFFADVVLVDEITVSASSALSNETRAVVDFADLPETNGYQVTTNKDEVDVYAYTTTGLLSSVESTNINGVTAFSSLPFQASSNNESQLRYAVGNADTWPSPSINITSGQDLHSQEADYLIVAHPTFIGDELNEFVEFKTELGYNVRVVDWLEVVNTYGYGNNIPAALNNFLRAANQLYTTDNVLIVGGHTYDYFGITNDSIVNFIPSHYRKVSVFEYTATDNPYADLDGDNLPDMAIGRWPVRSIADLQTIIKKTKDWHQNREDDPYQDAYLLAQATDGQNLDFAEQLNGRVKSPLSLLDEINDISMLSLDALPEGVSDVVAFTRSELAGQINSGTDLVSFSGHGSPTAWGFQNIINTDFIKGLENQGEPVLLMPLACYITHYESVTTNTLAHQWMFAGDIGAAAIHGASVLGEYRDNGLFAERYLRKAKSTNTIGQAILQAKRELGSQSEMLHNWALLGDPTLPIR